MKPAEHLIVLSELVNEVCGLNHKHDPRGTPPATNVLVVPIGYNKNEVEAVAVRELTIPICEECAETLGQENSGFVLMICLECSSTQWISTYHSRLSYHNTQTQKDHKIIFLNHCPHCAEKKADGVWFG